MSIESADGPIKVRGVNTKHEFVEVDGPVTISVPVRWFGVDELIMKIDQDGIWFVGNKIPGKSLPPGVQRTKVEGTGHRTFANIIEHEVLNHWNRY